MITIRKTAQKHENLIEPSINEAKKFLKKKYPKAKLDDVDYIFSCSYSRSRYFHNNNNPKYPNPMVCICVRAKLYLYTKKSVGYTAEGAHIGIRPQMVCALIHELTHHIQRQEKRSASEVETTKNEVEYLSQFPKLFKKLTPIK